MNKDTERSLWMGGKLGHNVKIKHITHAPDLVVYEGSVLEQKIFSLANSAKAREAAVIWLGEEYCASITPEYNMIGNQRYPTGRWEWCVGESFDVDDTYKEALYAAIDYLMEKV